MYVYNPTLPCPVIYATTPAPLNIQPLFHILKTALRDDFRDGSRQVEIKKTQNLGKESATSGSCQSWTLYIENGNKKNLQI